MMCLPPGSWALPERRSFLRDSSVSSPSPSRADPRATPSLALPLLVPPASFAGDGFCSLESPGACSLSFLFSHPPAFISLIFRQAKPVITPPHTVSASISSGSMPFRGGSRMTTPAPLRAAAGSDSAGLIRSSSIGWGFLASCTTKCGQKQKEGGGRHGSVRGRREASEVCFSCARGAGTRICCEVGGHREGSERGSADLLEPQEALPCHQIGFEGCRIDLNGPNRPACSVAGCQRQPYAADASVELCNVCSVRYPLPDLLEAEVHCLEVHLPMRKGKGLQTGRSG